MYFDGKKQWNYSERTESGRIEFEVIEIDNGFICKKCVHTYKKGESYDLNPKETIVYTEDNPITEKIESGEAKTIENSKSIIDEIKKTFDY